MTPDLELLKPALEMAFIVARSGESAPLRIDAPRELRPFLRFSRVVPRALVAAQRALEDDEFRARVAAACDEEEVGAAGWLFLTRPEGWREVFDTFVEERAAVRDHAAEAVVARQLAEALERIAALEAELRAVEQARDRARAEAESAQALGHSRGLELESAETAAEAARSERTRAVRELKDLERLLARRTEELRDARRGTADGDPEVPPVIDVDRIASALEEMQSLWNQVAARMCEIEDALGTAPRAGSIERPPAAAAVPNIGGPRRRMPLRLGHGLVDGTVEAARWLLAQPDLLLVVDGYNVTLLAWPNLALADQRTALERAVGTVRSGGPARTGATVRHDALRHDAHRHDAHRHGQPLDAVIVYDGDEAAGSVSRSAWAPEVRLVYTAADVEADDEILAIVERDHHTTIVVVSNDRRVLDGARARGANVIRSTEFVGLLR